MVGPLSSAMEASSPPDDTLHKYRILGKKGEGSFAEVMACQNLSDGQLYACKTLKKHFANVEQALGLTEVRALRRLRPHLNVVQLYDVIFDKKSGRLALVFELMDLNMYELLKARKKPLPEFRVKSYIYQLLRSLDHIHRHGIFHRDVKPENLLIKDNLLKLGDFGSCRGIRTRRPYTEYISTRWYRPPECLLTSGHYSLKMDIWAAGCVLFEALTNLPLFPGSSELDQLSKIHNVLGTPKSSVISKLRRHKKKSGAEFDFPARLGLGLAVLVPGASEDALQLLATLCSYDEDDRPLARYALRHPYFADLRAMERYKHSNHRESSYSKRSSPRSVSCVQVNSNASTREKKLIRQENALVLPNLDQSERSSGRSCKTHRSINLPPIAIETRHIKDIRNPTYVNRVIHLPPLLQPWRP